MRIIIIGGGQVGTELARRLSRDHDVVVIEKDNERAKAIEADIDVLVVRGNGASIRMLEQAGIQEASLLIAVTEIDEVNIIACMLAKQYNTETTVARIRSSEYADGSQVLTNEQLGIDIIINPERVAAQEIAKMINNPYVSEIEYYADGRVQVIGNYIEKDSPYINKEVKNLDLPDDCIVCAIARQRGEVIIPGGDDIILPLDELFFLGKKETFEKPWFSSKTQKPSNEIVIAGGGRVGIQLAEMLEREEKYEIRIIERNKEKSQEISERLNRALVLQGDVTDINFLKDEEISRADVFVAVTGDDEINLLSTLLADHLNVKVTISEVIRPDYNIIHSSIGIDRVVSPRLLTAAQIMKLIRRGNIISLTILKEDKAEVVELIVSQGAPVCDKPLEKAGLPRGILVGAIVRGEEIIIPSGDNKINAGDRVIVFYLSEMRDEVEKIFFTGEGPVKGIERVWRNFIRGK